MHRYNPRGWRGVGWRAKPPPLHPCGQLTRCFSAVAELLVVIFGANNSVLRVSLWVFNNYPFVICCPTCFLPPTPPKKSLAPKCGWLGAWNVCVCCRLALMNEEPGINIENLGDVRWHLCLCLVLAWILVIIFVSRGIQSTGKVTSSGFKLEFSFFDRIILS